MKQAKTSFEVVLGTVGEDLLETRAFSHIADAEDFARGVIQHPSQSVESATVYKVERKEISRYWK